MPLCAQAFARARGDCSCVHVTASRVRALARTCVERFSRYLVQPERAALVLSLGGSSHPWCALVLSLLVCGSLSWVLRPGVDAGLACLFWAPLPLLLLVDSWSLPG